MTSRIERLERLDALRKMGAISDAEFEEQKAKVLDASAFTEPSGRHGLQATILFADVIRLAKSLRNKVQTMATESALRDLQGLNLAQKKLECAERVFRIQKTKWWALGFLSLFGVSQFSGMNLSLSGIVIPLIIATISFASCFCYYVWVTQKTRAYAFVMIDIENQVANDSELSEVFARQNEGLQRKAREETDAREIEELRRQLRAWHGLAGQAEARGDFAEAGKYRGLASETESMLRQRSR